LQPQHPLNVAGEIKAPVLGLYAGEDKGIPASDIDMMREALKKARPKTQIIVYPDAQHGFNADYRPSYNAADAQDGWKRMLAWFNAHGVRAG
jgi:carboxymethylenebutenolidase